MKRAMMFAALVVLVAAGLAWALPDAEPWESVNVQRDHKKPVRFNRQAYAEMGVQTTFVDAGALNVGGFSFNVTGRGTVVYDFPTLGGNGSPQDTICAESNAGTATGCAFGDGVLLGIDQAPVNAFGTLNAYVSASGAFKVRACATGITDAGSFNMPDASYTATCVR